MTTNEKPLPESVHLRTPFLSHFTKIADKEELEAKIQHLEQRLNDRKEALLEKELILEEVTRLSDKLRLQVRMPDARQLQGGSLCVCVCACVCLCVCVMCVCDVVVSKRTTASRQ
jgi:hypothetical protein